MRPDIENRIKAGQIAAMFETRVKEFTEEEVVVIEKHGGEKRLPAKQVFALTGYHPDYTFIKGLGVRLDEKTLEAGVESGDAGEQCSGDFSGWGGDWREADQRDFYREREISREADY